MLKTTLMEEKSFYSSLSYLSPVLPPVSSCHRSLHRSPRHNRFISNQWRTWHVAFILCTQISTSQPNKYRIVNGSRSSEHFLTLKISRARMKMNSLRNIYVEFYLYPIGLELLSMSYYCSLNVVAPLLQDIIWTNNVNGKSCLVPSWMLNAVSFKSIFHEPFCLWLAKRTWSDASSTGFLISRFHLSNFLMIALKHIMMMNHNEPSGRMLWWDWDLLALISLWLIVKTFDFSS